MLQLGVGLVQYFPEGHFNVFQIREKARVTVCRHGGQDLILLGRVCDRHAFLSNKPLYTNHPVLQRHVSSRSGFGSLYRIAPGLTRSRARPTQLQKRHNKSVRRSIQRGRFRTPEVSSRYQRYQDTFQ